jgi:GNAT superfamily N-acetyltransferase
MEPRVEIRRVPGDDPAAVALVAALETEFTPQFGPMTPEATSTVRPDEMIPPDGVFILVLEDERVVAGGGVRRLSDGVAEIKRMYVMPDARGRGFGRRVLTEIEAAAVDLGFERLRLDTASSLEVALSMYRRSGYVDIPDYNGNPYATFWGEKTL